MTKHPTSQRMKHDYYEKLLTMQKECQKDIKGANELRFLWTTHVSLNNDLVNYRKELILKIVLELII